LLKKAYRLSVSCDLKISRPSLFPTNVLSAALKETVSKQLATMACLLFVSFARILLVLDISTKDYFMPKELRTGTAQFPVYHNADSI